jgi:hypothetical protein
MPEPRRPAPGEGSARARSVALVARREALERSLAGRFWLRFHASVMIAGTFATGFLANAAMLALPVHSVWLRWPLAVLAGYGAFFVLVRLWLAYVGIKPLLGRARSLDERERDGGWSVDLPIGSGGGSGGGGGSFGGGGGGSGGAGASAAFDSPRGAPALASFGSSGGPGAGATTDAPPTGGWLGSGGGKGDGLFSGLGDGDGFLVVVLGLIVLAIVAALVGGAVHVVWIAPDLLSDAAFGAMLSAGVVPGLHRANEPDWNGHVFRATLPVIAGVMAVVLLAAWTLTHYFPGAQTLGEAFRSL